MLTPVALYHDIVDQRIGGANTPLLVRRLLVIVKALFLLLGLAALAKVPRTGPVTTMVTGSGQEVRTTTVVSIGDDIGHDLRRVIRLHRVVRIGHSPNTLRITGYLPIGLVVVMLIEKRPNRPLVMSPENGFSIQVAQKIALDKNQFSTNLSESDFPSPSKWSY